MVRCKKVGLNYGLVVECIIHVFSCYNVYVCGSGFEDDIIQVNLNWLEQ